MIFLRTGKENSVTFDYCVTGQDSTVQMVKTQKAVPRKNGNNGNAIYANIPMTCQFNMERAKFEIELEH